MGSKFLWGRYQCNGKYGKINGINVSIDFGCSEG